MAEDFDKTEEATPFKLREARKKGQVARSMELNYFLGLLVFVIITLSILPGIMREFSNYARQLILSSSAVSFEPGLVTTFGQSELTKVFFLILPIFAIIVLGGILINILQSGFVVSFEPLKPNFNKLNPVEGFKKLFSLQKLFETFKSILKIGMIAAVFYIGFDLLLPHLIDLSRSFDSSIPNIVLKYATVASIVLLTALLPVVLIDFIFSRKEFARKMRMSKRDVKDEHKRHEGNPEVKSKRRQIQKELINKTSSISSVTESDLIIVNPTHYAIALKYDQNSMIAPIVLAKGRGKFAMDIKELARSLNKRIYERKELARELYRASTINKEIPLSTYQGVAAVYKSYLANTAA